MFAITVTEKGGEQRRLDFDKQEVTIGRVQGNDVVLPKGNVSKKHARIVLKDGKFIIVDLKSTNGTYVNGRKITSPLVVKDADKIYIGDFILGVEEGAGSSDAPSPAPPGPPPGALSSMPGPVGSPPSGPMSAPGSSSMSGPPGPPPGASMPSMAGPAPGMSSAPSSPPASLGGPPPPMMPPGGPPPSVRATEPRPSQNPPPALAEMAPRPQPASNGAGAPAAMPSPAPAPAPAKNKPRMVGVGAKPRPLVVRRPVEVKLDGATRDRLSAQRAILDRLVPRLELDDVPVHRLGDEDLWEKAEAEIGELLDSLKSSEKVQDGVDDEAVVKGALSEALGLGALEELLAADDVDEILVDRCDRILVRKGDEMTGSGLGFSSDEVLGRVIRRLVEPAGARVGPANPVASVRLRDGALLHVAVAPVAVTGGCLHLVKPRRSPSTLADLTGAGVMSPAMSTFLDTCVGGRRNVLVCGSNNGGKDRLLSALAAAAPEGERVVSVENVASISLERSEWIALEAPSGPGANTTAADVVHSALKMAPDRLIVADIGGAEGAAVLSALATSVDGALIGCGGSSASAGLERLAAAVRMGSPSASQSSARDLVAAAIDVVVCVSRFADGEVRILEVAEVLGAEDTGVKLQPLFTYRGGDGGFRAAGVVPRFYAELDARGMNPDSSIFR